MQKAAACRTAGVLLVWDQRRRHVHSGVAARRSSLASASTTEELVLVIFGHCLPQDICWIAADRFLYLSTEFRKVQLPGRIAARGSQVVHIVDLSFSATHPWQWLKLLHDFRRRPEGPPELYLTVVHDDDKFLASMQELLSKEAESLEMSLHFIPVIGILETLDFSNLHSTFQIKYGAAVAISCALQMHRLLVVDDNLSSTGTAQLQQMANFTQQKQMTLCAAHPPH